MGGDSERFGHKPSIIPPFPSIVHNKWREEDLNPNYRLERIEQCSLNYRTIT